MLKRPFLFASNFKLFRMLERDPQEHVRLYNERFDYFVEFIEKGQIWFDNDHQISLALKKLRGKVVIY